MATSKAASKTASSISISSALTVFQSRVDSIGKTAKFVRDSDKLRPRLNAFLNWDLLGQTPDAKPLVSQFLEFRDDSSIVYSSLFLSAHGCFEKYLRDAAEEYASRLAYSYEELEKICPGLVKWNVKLSALALATIFEPPHHVNYDYKRIAEDAATSFINSQKVVINGQAMAQRKSNIDKNEINELFRRFGREPNWDKIGTNETLQGLLSANNARKCAHELELHLLKAVRLRNNLAHSGVGNVVLTYEELMNHTAVSKALATELDKLLFS